MKNKNTYIISIITAVAVIVLLLIVMSSCNSVSTETEYTHTNVETIEETTSFVQTTSIETTNIETTSIETTDKIVETETTKIDIPVETRYKRGEYDFEKIEYVHYEYSDWEKTLKEILDADDKEAEDKLLDLFEYMQEYYYSIHTMRLLSEFEYYKDTTNVNNKDEYEYNIKLYNKVLASYMLTSYKLVYEGKLKDFLQSNLSEEDLEYILTEAKKYTEEYTSILSKISELQNEYLNLSNTVKVYDTMFRMQLTMREILEKYNGRLDIFSYGVYKNTINSYYTNYANEAAVIYGELIGEYKKLARLNGYDDLEEYINYENYEREYTDTDIMCYEEYVKKYIVPLQRKLKNGITSTHETIYENYNKTSDAIEKYKEYYEEYFKEVSPDMYEAYEYLNEFNLIYLGYNENQANMSFTTVIPEYDLPYIFINCNNKLSDLNTFIHEFGHFYSYYISDTYSLHSDPDYTEIISQANELLFEDKYYKEMFPNGYETLMKFKIVEKLDNIIESAIQYKFQREAFKLDEINYDTLSTLYRKIFYEFSYSMGNLEGFIKPEDYWALYSHSFVAPLYYLSYGVSTLPALEIYSVSLEKRENGIEVFNTIAKYDYDTTFISALMDSGLYSPFEEEAYIKIVRMIKKITNIT